MFSGLVEEVGEVSDVRIEQDGSFVLSIRCPHLFGCFASDMHLGDSVAVDGVCLTITHMDTLSTVLQFGCAPETLRRTTLGSLVKGTCCNLELAMKANSRFGGHFVEGHVDSTGTLLSKTIETESMWLRIQCPVDLLRYIVEKGYIAIDGTSLTVCSVHEDSFTVMLVAYTQQKIALPSKALGDTVNLEVDILGKYVDKLLEGRSKDEAQSITPDVVESVRQHVFNSFSDETIEHRSC